MDLRLENGRLYLADVQNLLDLPGVEVGQADGLHLALLICLFHLLVPGHIVAGGLVDQQQVNIVGIQPLQGLVYCVGLLIETGPQLGLQEDVLAPHTGLFHGPAHCFFVHISVGGVDEPVAALEGAEDGGLRFIRRQQEGPDTRHRHFHAVIQSRKFHTSHPSISEFCRIVFLYLVSLL